MKTSFVLKWKCLVLPKTKKDCFSKTGLNSIPGIFSHICFLAGTPSIGKQIRDLCQLTMIIMCGKTIIAIIGLHNGRRSVAKYTTILELIDRLVNSQVIPDYFRFFGNGNPPSFIQIYKYPPIPKWDVICDLISMYILYGWCLVIPNRWFFAGTMKRNSVCWRLFALFRKWHSNGGIFSFEIF